MFTGAAHVAVSAHRTGGTLRLVMIFAAATASRPVESREVSEASQVTCSVIVLGRKIAKLSIMYLLCGCK